MVQQVRNLILLGGTYGEPGETFLCMLNRRYYVEKYFLSSEETSPYNRMRRCMCSRHDMPVPQTIFFSIVCAITNVWVHLIP